MSRYIDADALWDKMQKFYTDGDCGDDDGYNLGINVGITKCHNLLTKVPSIEIIRCGECKYWKNSLCHAWHRVIPKDGYCSIGEKDGSTQTETQNSNLTFDTPQTYVYDYKGNGKWERSE